MAATRILIVEDEGIVALDIQQQLIGLGYDVPAMAASGEDAIRKAAETRPDLVLMDIRLKGEMDGIQAAQHIQARSGIPIIYATAHSDEATLQRAKITGPFGYVLKPFETRELHIAIEIALYRHQMELQLKRYAARLEQSNRDLRDFIHIASHDLQEPLRKVQAFGARLGAEYGQALGDQGRSYLARIQKAMARMQSQIDGLMDYTRVTTNAQPFQSVDLAEIVRGVVSDMETRIKKVGGRVEVGDLPAIDADPIQIRQLISSLVGNAVKFQRTGEAPVVRIHGRRLNGRDQQTPGHFSGGEVCQLMVEDNGIGFDERYLDRIFHAFQRLHGRDEYEGTGMGLAICRKIVERHGGGITATSTPGLGTTFIVTLPIQQPSRVVANDYAAVL